MLSPALPGDANLDGKVDVNDLTVVLTNFGKTGRTWATGDFVGDGKVDVNDLTIVLANFGRTFGARPAAMFPPCPSLPPWCFSRHWPAGLRLAEAEVKRRRRRSRAVGCVNAPQPVADGAFHAPYGLWLR